MIDTQEIFERDVRREVVNMDDAEVKRHCVNICYKLTSMVTTVLDGKVLARITLFLSAINVVDAMFVVRYIHKAVGSNRHYNVKARRKIVNIVQYFFTHPLLGKTISGDNSTQRDKSIKKSVEQLTTKYELDIREMERINKIGRLYFKSEIPMLKIIELPETDEDKLTYANDFAMFQGKYGKHLFPHYLRRFDKEFCETYGLLLD